jgi:hypothetical protein
MNKPITFASLITIIVLTLAYLGYIPSYISVTISLCIFAIAISNSICSVIRGSITEIKDSQKEYNATILKSYDSLYEKIEMLVNALEENTISTASQIENVHSILEQSYTTQQTTCNFISQSLPDLSEQLKAIGEKSDSFTNALNVNSTEVAKLNDVFTSFNKGIQENVEKIDSITKQNTEKFSKAIVDANNNLRQQIECIVSELNTLNNSINVYTESTISVKETNSTLSAEISKAITSNSRDNRRMTDDLKDVISSNLEELISGIKKAAIDQTSSLSESEDKIRQSINKLCNSLTSNLQKLGIDIEAICESVDDMKKISQSVEQSDKDLLSRISKICK